MNQELTDKLVERFPLLFKFYKNEVEPKYNIYYGVETGDGWFTVIDDLLYKLETEIHKTYPETLWDNFVLHQIKEKFGQLRVYLSDRDDILDNLITQANVKALGICVTCGSTDRVTRNFTGFIRTLCNPCMTEFKNRDYRLNEGEL